VVVPTQPGRPLSTNALMQLEANLNEAATRARGQSIVRTANRYGVGLTVASSELDGQQTRALLDAYDQRKAGYPQGRVPASDRGRVNTFTATQGHLRPQLQRIGVPLNPLPCTCPPCGPTQQSPTGIPTPTPSPG